MQEGVISKEEVDKIISEINAHFEREFEHSQKLEINIQNTINPKYKGSRALTHKWQGLDFSQCGKEPEHTGYDASLLKDFALKSVHLPQEFNAHPRL